MASNPLLASARPSSETSDDRAGVEEDTLLTGQGDDAYASGRRNKYGWGFWREVGLFVWAFVATVAVIIFAVLYQHQRSEHGSTGGDGIRPPGGKKNMIFMVSDGMGPTSLSLTRSFRQFESGLSHDDVLVLDKHLIGSSRTRSTSSLITDSAAGATAFSCGFKSYNGAISVRPDHTPCGTVLEAAKKAGYMTGLVVTTRITDATPACFAAHVNSRDQEDRIAEQEVGEYPLGRVVDLMLGGGRCHFLPNTTEGSCRGDDKDVVEMAKKNGFSYIDDREGFDGLNVGGSVKLPLLGLFAETDIPYEVDRRHMNDVYPSLDEMAQTALTALADATRDSEKGFFLMIEGSRIDHAGHSNDPVAQVHEVLAYDKAFSGVLKFLDDWDTEAAVVSTSDHETGGLSTAKQLHITYPDYVWYPGVFVNASHSGEKLAADLNSYTGEDDIKTYVRETLLKEGLGVSDATDEEVQSLIDNPRLRPWTFPDIISRRAQVGWSTHGHSAVDVNIYASGSHGSNSTLSLSGNHENTEVGEFIRDYLELDLQGVTDELVEKGTHFDTLDAAGSKIPGSWMGRLPEPEERLDAFDHYHGDFKRHVHES
ncbi:MAG: hypothetical protein M1837_001982 [Sclerophora amabilis]|nr:MAG: hypothetical protein M1837_001982 [Sclerophora amabilis]